MWRGRIRLVGLLGRSRVHRLRPLLLATIALTSLHTTLLLLILLRLIVAHALTVAHTGLCRLLLLLLRRRASYVALRRLLDVRALCSLIPLLRLLPIGCLLRRTTVNRTHWLTWLLYWGRASHAVSDLRLLTRSGTVSRTSTRISVYRSTMPKASRLLLRRKIGLRIL